MSSTRINRRGRERERRDRKGIECARKSQINFNFRLLMLTNDDDDVDDDDDAVHLTLNFLD